MTELLGVVGVPVRSDALGDARTVSGDAAASGCSVGSGMSDGSPQATSKLVTIRIRTAAERMGANDAVAMTMLLSFA